MTANAAAAVAPSLRSGPDAPLPAAAGHLVEALLCDLHWTMLHVGALAQLTRAHGGSQGGWSLRPWRHLLHDSSATTFLALRFAPQFGLSDSLTADLAAFYRALSKLQADMLPTLGDGRPHDGLPQDSRLQDGRPHDGRIAAFAARWRELTSEGERLLLAFEAENLRDVGPLYTEDRRMLVAFLRESQVAAARVDRVGEIALPVLKQRRRTARATVDHACRIVTEGVEHAARFVDLSLEGVGLVCRRALGAGQPLELVIGARRLPATVVWADGERYGLRLTKPLRRDDPLFGG